MAIEYNGSVFHADPRLFADNQHCDPFRKHLSAHEIREMDKNRIEVLDKFFNIKTYIIWEEDYKKRNGFAKIYK